MNSGELIDIAHRYVKESLSEAEGGHDWWHVYRVWKMAARIADSEPVDRKVVELAALLHDIADPKFHDGDESIGPNTAYSFLSEQAVSPEIIDHVVQIIRYMSFKNRSEVPSFNSLEMQVVQDADKLDAIGAIGIARVFSFGGFKGNPIHDPNMKPRLNMTKSEYKKSNGSSINHFYEKLLLLKDLMHTNTGREIAQSRHDFMQLYLDQFFREFEGEQ